MYSTFLAAAGQIDLVNLSNLSPNMRGRSAAGQGRGIRGYHRLGVY